MRHTRSLLFGAMLVLFVVLAGFAAQRLHSEWSYHREYALWKDSCTNLVYGYLPYDGSGAPPDPIPLGWPLPDAELTRQLGKDAHLHVSFLKKQLDSHLRTYMILDESPVLRQKYGKPGDNFSETARANAWGAALGKEGSANKMNSGHLCVAAQNPDS